MPESNAKPEKRQSLVSKLEIIEYGRERLSTAAPFIGAIAAKEWSCVLIKNPLDDSIHTEELGTRVLQRSGDFSNIRWIDSLVELISYTEEGRDVSIIFDGAYHSKGALTLWVGGWVCERKLSSISAISGFAASLRTVAAAGHTVNMSSAHLAAEEKEKPTFTPPLN